MAIGHAISNKLYIIVRVYSEIIHSLNYGGACKDGRHPNKRVRSREGQCLACKMDQEQLELVSVCQWRSQDFEEMVSICARAGARPNFKNNFNIRASLGEVSSASAP